MNWLVLWCCDATKRFTVESFRFSPFAPYELLHLVLWNGKRQGSWKTGQGLHTWVEGRN